MSSKIRVVGAAMASVMLLSVAASPAALGKGRPLKAVLSGDNEVPAVVTEGSGIAKLRLNQGKRRVCYKIQLTDIGDAVAAHIHEGEAGVNGLPVVTLGTPDATGYVEGCVDDVARPLIKDMRKNRSDYYVNVHTTTYPDGEVRGQLQKMRPGRNR